jgi:peptidoglycan/LPS O-acetylase OafA/YrhL
MGVHSHLSWNYPSWSISTEFFAYIAFFLITLTIDRKNSLVVPFLITIGSYLFIFNLNYPNLDITYDFGFIRCIGAFYIGVFLFRLKPKLTILDSEKWIIGLEIITILMLIAAVSFSNSNKVILAFTIVSFAFVLLVFSSSKSGFLGKILETFFMREIGIRSYSIYMLLGITWGIILNIFIHLLRINPERTFGLTSILVNLVVISIIIILSKYTYRFVEKKFRDLIKKKLNY